jgi:hypothetical protein
VLLGEKHKGARGSIWGDREGREHIYINLRSSRDNLVDRYFDPGSRHENLKGGYLRDSCTDPGAAVAQLVETLRYKPESHGFDSRWCHWNFSLA